MGFYFIQNKIQKFSHGLQEPMWNGLSPTFSFLKNGSTVNVQASQVALMVKNLPVNAGDVRDAGSIPGSGRSPRGGHSNPLQYSCLENPTYRGAWWATLHGVAKSWTWLKWLSSRSSSSSSRVNMQYYMLQVYNIAIYNFKGYAPLTLL